MSKKVKECKGYCNFQPVFEDEEQTRFKYYQCKDCGYILTDGDIAVELSDTSKMFEFDEFFKDCVALAKQNPNEFNEGFIAGMISAVHRIGIIDNEKLEQYIKEAGIKKHFYDYDESEEN